MKSGRPFYKMSGSGNDFVFFNLSDGPTGSLEDPEVVAAISARGTGVGSDGVVFLRSEGPNQIAMRYYNSDGSLGELCGNATLCSLRLANHLGIVGDEPVSISTDAGTITARMSDGLPEIDLAPVTEVSLELPSIVRTYREARLGFARVGVPHVVIIDSDNRTADVMGRGSQIRRDQSLRDGANVNFLTSTPDGWTIRTYERGVEGETLACGTGAVASAILLSGWGEEASPVTLRTRSDQTLSVRVKRVDKAWHPSLRGSAELVFTGDLTADFSR